MKRSGKPKTAKANKLKVAPAKLSLKASLSVLAGFEKVSAVEGLRLTGDMKRTFGRLERRGASAAERRAAIIKRYG
jgi:hypothetical protein